MRNFLLLAALMIFSMLLNTNTGKAAFVEFKPQTAKFVSPKPKASAQIPPAGEKNQSFATNNNQYIKTVVTNTVNEMLSQGLLKGEKGDKGDVGGSVLGAYTNENIAPAPVTYNQDYGGSFAGVTQLSGQEMTAGDLTVTASLTVNSSAPLEVDSASNFTASSSMTDLTVATIESPSGAFLSDGGVWTNASARGLKENFATVTPAGILTKIDNLPIYTWNYKKENAGVMHMGPVAEDFYESFGLGNSSSSISTIDPAGVALVGIQALNQKINAFFETSVLGGFKKLGLEITDGFIKAKNFAADFIQTKNLEVGSADQPAGITIYDRATKQPVCVFAESSIIKSQAGKCSDLTFSNPVTQALATEQSGNQSNLTNPAASSSVDSVLPLPDNNSPAILDINPNATSTPN